MYGQDHIHRTLIGETGEQHDAVGDAIKSMRLLQLYNLLKDDPEKFDESMVNRCLRLALHAQLQNFMDLNLGVTMEKGGGRGGGGGLHNDKS